MSGNGSALAKQIESFVAAGGVSALVMGIAAAYRAWQQAKGNGAAPRPVGPTPAQIEAENEQLRKRLAELEKKEQK